MLKLEVKKERVFDEASCRFIHSPSTTLYLQHSLISVSKWEAIWHKSFMPPPVGPRIDKSEAELVSYIQCMSIKGPIDPTVALVVISNYGETIEEYISNPNTATVITYNVKQKPSRQTITSELIYYWMIRFNIPHQYEKWHLNRLLTLIEVCNVKEQAEHNKMSNKDILKQNAALNKARGR